MLRKVEFLPTVTLGESEGRFEWLRLVDLRGDCDRALRLSPTTKTEDAIRSTDTLLKADVSRVVRGWTLLILLLSFKAYTLSSSTRDS